MHRKEYKRLASIIFQLKRSLWSGGYNRNELRAIGQFEENILNWLSEDNPRFDRNKFLALCHNSPDESK